MQPITSYAASNDFLRLLLQGPPGSGKSDLCMQLPGVYFVDFDVNLGGPLRRLSEKNGGAPPPNIIGYDTVDRVTETGVAVPVTDRYIRLEKLLLDAQANPQVQTIVLDSATMMVDVLVAETLRKQNKSMMDKQMWGFFFTYSKYLMSTLTSMRKHIVVTAHEKINKNPDGSVAYPIKVAWPGQFGQIIGAFFTNVWRTEVAEGFVNGRTAHTFKVRTMPSFNFELKNTLGLPPEFEFSWPLVESKLKGTKK